MEHVVALLLLVGCSDDLAHCRELPAPAPVYETVDACEQDMNHAFANFSSQHPQVLGQCLVLNEDALEFDAELVWEITEGGHLAASVETAATGFELASTDGPQVDVRRQ
jgi:hypothetical protein